MVVAFIRICVVIALRGVGRSSGIVLGSATHEGLQAPRRATIAVYIESGLRT